MSKSRIIAVVVGILLLLYGLAVLAVSVGREDYILMGGLSSLAGFVLTILGVRKREVVVTGDFRVEASRKGKTAFEGTVVGKPFEIDQKKVWMDPRGPQTKFKAAVKVKVLDKEGNPLGIAEAVFDSEDNYKALSDGDRVRIRGKWRKDGRIKVKEGKNLTSNTFVTKRHRFKWVKRLIYLIIFLIIIYFLYEFMRAL